MAGGGSRTADDGKKKARIEIIPLIDVIFFLLATFVLFTLSLNRIQSLPVNLPVASGEPAPDQENDSVTIQISDQKTCYWRFGDGTPELINIEEVAPKLEQYKTQTHAPRVLISGDDRAKFGPTVAVLDEVRKAGIQQVSVETRVRATGK
jgi:biopolymer transport protein ExbD